MEKNVYKGFNILARFLIKIDTGVKQIIQSKQQ